MEALLEDPLGTYNDLEVTLPFRAQFFEIPELPYHEFTKIYVKPHSFILHRFERTNRFKNDRRVYLRVQKSDVES